MIFTKEDLEVWNSEKSTLIPLKNSFLNKFHIKKENNLISNVKYDEILFEKEFIDIPTNIKNNRQKDRKYFDYILDLHGLTIDQAYEKISNIILNEKYKYVLIITGKGIHSNTDDTIKTSFLKWLTIDKFKERIKKYKIADKKHGGDGAYYLWLK